MGSCQAGQSCPFSHASDTTAKAQTCKYFQKGNCKFGIKCALAHVLPDGSRVTAPRNSPSKGGSAPNSAASSAPAPAPVPNTTPVQPSIPPHSSSSTGSIWSQSPQTHWTSPMPTYVATFATSAITDDSDDELDLVPSSLSDLLTPQELTRRRSSQSKLDRASLYKYAANPYAGTPIAEGNDTQFQMDY